MPNIVSTEFASRMTRFAVGNVQTTLTAVSPTNTITYAANKQMIMVGFDIMEVGQEEQVNTRFFIAKQDYPNHLPTKGWILTDGKRNYKVMETVEDVLDATYRIDCASQYARTR